MRINNMSRVRKRSGNFTASERQLLTFLVHEQKEIINTKQNSSKACAAKKRAWERIAFEFNKASKQSTRSAIQLQQLWWNMRKTRNQLQRQNRQIVIKQEPVDSTGDQNDLDSVMATVNAAIYDEEVWMNDRNNTNGLAASVEVNEPLFISAETSFDPENHISEEVEDVGFSETQNDQSSVPPTKSTVNDNEEDVIVFKDSREEQRKHTNELHALKMEAARQEINAWKAQAEFFKTKLQYLQRAMRNLREDLL